MLKVHPGHVGLFDASMSFEIERVKGIKNMLFGADALFLAKLTGPGKVYLQTMPLANLAGRDRAVPAERFRQRRRQQDLDRRLQPRELNRPRAVRDESNHSRDGR